MPNTHIPFTSPQGLARARRASSSGFGPWGETIWDTLTYLGASGEYFITPQIIDHFRASAPHLKPYTALRYVLAFVAYTKACPAEFSGPASRLTRVGRKWIMLDQ